MTFMIAHGASVVVVRDGKRKTIHANTGEDFTDEEIASINRASPGSLRKPVNEGFGKAKPTPVEDDADDEDDDAPKETAKQRKAREKAEKEAAAEAKKAAAAKKAGTADEDEDI